MCRALRDARVLASLHIGIDVRDLTLYSVRMFFPRVLLKKDASTKLKCLSEKR